MKSTNFEKIFYPRNIAIVGVSADGYGFGRGILLSLLAMNYEGAIFPVNPRGGTCEGLKTYKRIEDIPCEIDFAIIAVPASLVPAALEECRKKGAAGAEIMSSGFRELGTSEGSDLEEEIKKIAARGIRVIGPNCFGIYCPESGLTFLPGPDLSRKNGNVAFISQSGGMSIDLANIGKWMGINFSKVISFGNGIDLRETELLNYLGQDPETHVISMYIEGIDDGESFYQTLRRVSSQKPVIVYKGGTSEAGGRAVASHTASMGGSRIIWESILRQARAIQTKDLLETAQACLAFSMLPDRVYKGITIIGGGGALGVAACDSAESYGLTLPPFSGEIYDSITEILPKPGSSAANPIDVANPHVAPSKLRDIMLNAARDERVDIQIQVPLLYHYKSLALMMGEPAIENIIPYVEMAEGAKEVVDKSGKPVVLVLPNARQSLDAIDVEIIMRKARMSFLERGIPVFDSLSDALRAISHVSSYRRRRSCD